MRKIKKIAKLIFVIIVVSALVYGYKNYRDNKAYDDISISKNNEEKSTYFNCEKKDRTVSGLIFKIPQYFGQYIESFDEYKEYTYTIDNDCMLYFTYRDIDNSISVEDNLKNALRFALSGFDDLEYEKPVEYKTYYDLTSVYLDFSFTSLLKKETGRVYFIFDLDSNTIVTVFYSQYNKSDNDYFDDVNNIVKYCEKVSFRSENRTTTVKKNTTKSTTKLTTKKTTTTTKTTTAEANIIRSDVKAAIDSYERFVDEYIAFLNKMANSSDLNIYSEYLDYMTKLTEYEEKFDKIADKDLNDAELAYYTEVQLRVSQKLINASVSLY